MTTSQNLAPRAVLCALAMALAACGGVDQTEDVVEWTEEELSKCSNGAVVAGIDVSAWQGNINWSAVAAAGKKFAFIRVSDGVQWVDSRFGENWRGAKAAGVLRGAYQFFRPGQDALRQANIVIEHVGRLQDGDLPVVLDVEVTDGVAASTIRSKIVTWIRAVQQGTGRVPIIYTNWNFWNQIGNPDALTGPALWVAHWGTSCPLMPEGFSSWRFHQYSDSGSVRGISGPVDLNRFNGSLEMLRQLANLGGDCVAGDTVYCGWNGVKGDPRTLFRCEGGVRKVQKVCATGCNAKGAGSPDSCEASSVCPLGNGLYCGGDMIGGERDTLYRCNDGVVTEVQRCANGCVWKPVGQDDACG